MFQLHFTSGIEFVNCRHYFVNLLCLQSMNLVSILLHLPYLEKNHIFTVLGIYCIRFFVHWMSVDGVQVNELGK